jgi:hypothetical protein
MSKKFVVILELDELQLAHVKNALYWAIEEFKGPDEDIDEAFGDSYDRVARAFNEARKENADG